MNHQLLHAATALVFSCAILPSLAQGPAFGIKAGVNFSTLSVDEADKNQPDVGLHGGLFARTSPSSDIGLQVELLYVNKGSHATYSTLFGLIDQELDLNMNYLELPVLASFRIGDIVDLQIGGYGAFLVNANIRSSGDLGTQSDDLDRDNFQSADFGIAGGVGFNLGSNLQLGLRYDHGLINVANSDAADLFLGNSKNRCVQFYVAVGVAGKS